MRTKDEIHVNDNLHMYNDLILGNQRKITWLSKDMGEQEIDAKLLEICRYAVEKLMRWSPEQIKEHLTINDIKRLRLQNVISKLSCWPPEIDKEKDVWYLAHLLYPEEMPFDRSDAAIVAMLSDNRLSKKFFNGPEGRQRAKRALRYLLDTDFSYLQTLEEKYAFFAAQKAKTILSQQYRMAMVFRWYPDALTLLHDTLGTGGSELLYRKYYFLKQNRKIKRSQYTKQTKKGQ